MKKILILVSAGVLVMTGCASMTKTEEGAVIGTGVGAAVGAGLGQAIGRSTGATLIGAAAGAAAGGLTGGLIGNYMDKQEKAMRDSLAGVEAANVQRNMDTLSVTFKSDVLFSVNSATLHPGAYDEMARVARVLKEYPQTTITVAGYTDSTGGEEHNLKLSQRRAEAVKTALVGQGVDAARITTVGYGASKPIADNSTPEGRQLNRRVEILINPQKQQ
jgi:outer membrane protein OmpA-like peptidoglycan-associated protein